MLVFYDCMIFVKIYKLHEFIITSMIPFLLRETPEKYSEGLRVTELERVSSYILLKKFYS